MDHMIRFAFATCFVLALYAASHAQIGPAPGAGGGTPGGSSTDVQCNVSNAFGACGTGRIVSSGNTLYLNPSGSNALVIGATTNSSSAVSLVQNGVGLLIERADNGAFASLDASVFTANNTNGYFAGDFFNLFKSNSQPSISGCSADTQTGGKSAGTFTSRTTGVCTVVATFSFTAVNGWSCAVNNLTTANLIRQTASTQTTATVAGTTVSGDVINFHCLAY